MSAPITTAASAFVGGVGVGTLIGWAADIQVLKAVSGQITAKPNTAAMLVATAVSLWLTARRPASFVARLLAAAVGAVAAITLAEHVLGADFGIDQALFVELPGASATASPGRMGPNACISFIFAAAALWLLNRGTTRGATLAQALAFGIGALALTALTGYISGAHELFAIARVSGIALQTALAFLALSIGLLAVRTDAGPIAVFISDRAGGLVLRRLAVLAVVLPIALGLASLAGQRAQLFDPTLGTALFSMSLVVLLGAAIWWTAYVLDRVDRSRAEAQHAVVETEARFRALANEAPVLIWVETAGVRDWFNVRWVEFTGVPLERLRREWERLIHPDDRAAYAAMRRNAAKTGTVHTGEYRLKRADGAFRWMLETAGPRRGAEGAVIGFVGSCVDITDRRELEQQAIAAREAAESASRMKDDFLATLSHELRTPLNAILGYARILRLDSLPEARRARALEVIERNALLQTQLIEDILDVSRITAGKLRLDTQGVDVVGVVSEAIESLRPAADAKGIKLSFVSDADRVTIRGDAARLQQVFWNVLSNAVKFTDQFGQVDVRLHTATDKVEVVVADNGIGIPSEFLPYVFDAFRQADSGFSRRFGGLGLGLSVCRRLVELHGGTIEARSEGSGRGATMTIRLPRLTILPPRQDVPSAADLAGGSVPSTTLAGIRVLVVDDEVEERELVRDILQHAGAVVTAASSAATALQACGGDPPDVIVTDLEMPGADGYELLRRIRASGAQTPAVAVTAYARSEDRARCLRAGFAAHVPKPIDPAALVSIVSGLRTQAAAKPEQRTERR